jgi:hypothetical protein
MITVGDYDPVYTNANGAYSILVEQGTHDVSCEADGYCIVEEDDVYISGSMTWNVEMYAPVMTVDPDDINLTLTTNGTATEYMTIYNDGDCDLKWNAAIALLDKTAVENLEIITYDRENLESLNPAQEWSPRVTEIVNGNTDDMWDVQFVYDVTTASGGTVSQAGVEFDGEFIYTSVWNTGGMLKFGKDGTYVGTYTITGASNIRDLAWDGEYLYGGAASTMIYQIDPTDFTVVNQFSSPENVRAIAYDDTYDAFWVCDWSTDFVLVGRDGSMIDAIANPGVESNYGLAFDNVSGAPSLWIFSQGLGGCDFYQLDIASGQLTGVTRNVLLDVPAAGAPIAGGAFLTTDFESGIVTLGGMIQADFDIVFGYELAAFDQWVTLGVNSGTVEPGSFQEVAVNINMAGYPYGMYEADINVTSTPDVGSDVVHVMVNYIVGIDDLTGGLIRMYPNPAVELVNIELTDNIKELQILNYMGQVVYEMNVLGTKKLQVNTQHYSSGSYTVHFIATNNEVTVKKLVITR